MSPSPFNCRLVTTIRTLRIKNFLPERRKITEKNRKKKEEESFLAKGFKLCN